MSKQPFSYYGGKQRLASKIIKYIPKHTVYVEPFLGGGSVFWMKPWPEVVNKDHYREVLNDYDVRLITFMRVLQDKKKFEVLQHKLQFTTYSQAEHLQARKILKEEVKVGDIDKAWAWFVQANMSFAGNIYGGWGTACYSANVSAAWANKIDISNFFERVLSTYISCEDALRCLKRWNSSQSFAYIDPPYIGSDCGHYKGYTEIQYKALIEFLDKYWQGGFILSGYETGFEKSCWEKISFETSCSAKGRTGYDRSKKTDESKQNRKRVENIWVRGNTTPVRKEIQKLYDSGKFDCFSYEPKQKNMDFIEEFMNE